MPAASDRKIKVSTTWLLSEGSGVGADAGDRCSDPASYLCYWMCRSTPSLSDTHWWTSVSWRRC